MKRRLKDLYPCRFCQTPSEVECQREIENAMCPSCASRLSELRSASSFIERAHKLHAEHNGAHTEAMEVAPWMFEAAAHSLNAARHLLKAAALNPNAPERAHWVQISITWSKWGTSLAKSTRRHLTPLAGARLTVVAPPGPIELTPPKSGHLQLMLVGGGP